MVVFVKLEMQPVCLCWKLPDRIVLPDACVCPAQNGLDLFLGGEVEGVQSKGEMFRLATEKASEDEL